MKIEQEQFIDDSIGPLNFIDSETNKTLNITKEEYKLERKSPFQFNDMSLDKIEKLEIHEIHERPEIKKEKMTFFQIIEKILCNLKDYLFMIGLFLSPMPFFSFLTLPYLFVGTLYIFLILNNSPTSKKFKLLAEIGCLIYSFLLLIFKLICFLSENNQFISNNKQFLINLGCGFLKDNVRNISTLVSFISDCSIFGLSIICLIISLCYKNGEIKKRKETAKAMTRYTTVFIWMTLFLVVALSCFSMSYITFILIGLTHFSFFIWIFCDGFIPLKCLQFSNYISTFVLIIALLGINYCNIDNLRDVKVKQMETVGIIKINLLDKGYGLEELFYSGLAYFLMVFCVLLMSSSFHILTIDVARDLDKSGKMIEGKDEQIEIEKIEEALNKSSLKKILYKIWIYLKSPYFILHFCRVGAITWIYLFHNYYSCFILLWLIISFLYNNISKIKLLVYFILIPSMYTSLFAFHLYNIPNLFNEPDDLRDRIKLSQWGLKKWENHQIIIYYSIINGFIMLMALLFRAILRYKPKIIQNKIKSKKKEVNELLEDFSIHDEDQEEPQKMSINSIEANYKEENDVTLSELLLKLLLTNIDKVTLIVMYILSMDNVNFTHLILLFMFMIQLLLPKVVYYLSYLFLIVIQIIFIGEYAFDLGKVFGLNSKAENIKFFINYDNNLEKTSIEIFLFGGIYCFYLQNQNYNLPIYNKLTNNKNATVESYIETTFANYSLIKKILFYISRIIMEIYVWILILLTFVFLFLFEINVLSAIKLLLFLLVFYKFLTSIQKSSSKPSIWLGRIFLIYCCIVTLLVYTYNLASLWGDKFEEFKNNTLKNKDLITNLPIYGLANYSDNYKKYFLPHFAINFLSLLFILETKRIITTKEKNQINKNSRIRRVSSGEIFIKELMDSEEDQISKKIKAEERYERNKAILFRENIKYIIFSVIVLLTKFYWLFLFFIVCILFTSYSLSLIMIIYLMIFGLSFIFMYSRRVRMLMSFISKPSFFITKLIRFQLVERPISIQSSKQYRRFAFKTLLFFSMLFIFLLYSYAVFDIFQNGCVDCLITKHVPIFGETTEDYIQATVYLIGFYVNINKNSLFEKGWVHLFLITLIGFDVYVQNLENYIVKETLKTDQKIKIYNKENKEIKEYFLRDASLLIDIDIELQKEINNENQVLLQDESNIAEDNFSDRFSRKKSFDYKFDEDKLIQGFKNIFKKASMKKIPTNMKTKTTSYEVIRMIKVLLEDFILVFLIIIAVTKINLWSYIYMIEVLCLFFSKKTVRKYYILLILLVICVLAQTLLFLSNITLETDPSPNKLVLLLVMKNLKIPWYNHIFSDSFGFFFGVGVGKLQMNLIWMDFIEICFIYVYLDYFSYAFYQDCPPVTKMKANKENKENKEIGISFNKKSKISYLSLQENEKLMKSMETIDLDEFTKIKSCLIKSFDIDLGNFYDFKNLFRKKPKEREAKEEEELNEISSKPGPLLSQLRLNKKKANQMEIKKQEAIKAKRENLKKICEKIFYLSLQYIVLISIIIITMMISGFISSIYICLGLYYLIKSTKLIIGKGCSYPNAIKRLLRVLIISDILLQLVTQFPHFTEIKEKYGGIKITLKAIGISQIINFDDKSSSFKMNYNELFLVYGKAICFYIMCVQVMIYSSSGFQEYYLSYLITRKDKKRMNSLMNVFWFNNNRIALMNNSIERRYLMNKAMDSLEKMLEDWNKKLNYKGKRKEEEKEEEENLFEYKIEKEAKSVKEEQKDKEQQKEEEQKDKEEQKEEELQKEEEQKEEEDKSFISKKKEHYIPEERVKEKIREFILGRFLVKILLFCHKRNSSYDSIPKEEKEEYIKEVIKGKTKMETEIENLVEQELKGLDLTEITKKDLKEIKSIIDNAKKIYNKKKDESNAQKKAEKEEMVKKLKEKKEKEKLLCESERKKRESISPEQLKKEKENEERERLEEEKRKLKEQLKKEKEEERRKNLSPKIIQFEKLIEKKLFTKYLRSTFLIKLIIEDAIAFLSINSHYICFFFMILNHMISASLISMFYPLSVFVFGILENPRPGKRYWEFIIKYTIVILIVKFIMAFEIWKEISSYNSFLETLEQYKIGFKFFDSTFTSRFFNYIVYDALVLLVILIQQFILIAVGLYKKTEPEIETIEEANERIIETKDAVINNKTEFNNKYLRENWKIQPNEGKGISFLDESSASSKLEIKKDNKKFTEKICEYYESLFPRIRNIKPGEDFYIYQTIGMLLIVIYIIIFYTKMDHDKMFGATLTKTRQFSGSMVLFVFVHVFFIICDRVIYIRQNRNNLDYKYKYYHKDTKKEVSKAEYDQIREDIFKKFPELIEEKNYVLPVQCIDQLKEQYEIVQIQNEEVNLPLIFKYVLHILISLFSHIFIFFFLTMYGNYNIYSSIYCPSRNKNDESAYECNDFSKNGYLIGFYLIYLVYLFSSGIQVKNGIMDIRRKSLLKEGETIIHSVIYNGYKAIPFLYEIKLSIDWAFTSTSLDLFQWNKFESIYDQLYITMCQMRFVNKKPVGLRIALLNKIFLGGGMMAILLILILGPLILFSSLNPTNEFNDVIGAAIYLFINFRDSNLLFTNYTLFKNEFISNIRTMNNDTEDTWRKYDYGNSSETKTFPKKQIQIIKMSSTSDSVWDLPKPNQDLILYKLGHYKEEEADVKEITISFRYKFNRKNPPESKEALKHLDIELYNYRTNKDEEKIIQSLIGLIDNCTEEDILLKKFYIPSIRLTSSERPKVINDTNYAKFQDVYLSLKGCNESIYQSYITLQTVNQDKNKTGIEFHAFNYKVSETTFGLDVLTFYVTFVLLAGSYIRNFFAGEEERVMLTEMPEPDQILNLCEGIKTSRHSYEHEKEEQLYYVLIEIMRSPEYLRMLTTSSLAQFKKRKRELKNPEDEEF